MIHEKGYVDPEYLRIVGEQLAQVKRKTYAALHIEPGERILDVGCGPATDTVPMAALVGNSGQVAGVDADPAMIETAERRAALDGLSDRVTHKVGDATALPFGDGEFHACRSERLFQHLLDPVRALAEMVRVTMPGGWIVNLDTDWGSLSIDYDNPDVSSRLARILAEHVLNNGYAPRSLYRLYKQQGIRNISIEIIPVPVTSYPMGRMMALLDRSEKYALETNQVSPEELDRWHNALQLADETGTFFASVSMILIAGQR